MAVNSGIFNSVAGDRKYDASWFAEYFATFIGNGIFPNPSNGMQVMEHNNMQTVIKPGKGWINGYYVTNTEDYFIQHDVADSSLSRIDRIVLQKSTADRAINIVVKKGALASSPTPPAIARNADYHELVLADVRVSAGTTRIIQGNITDQRLNNALCGIVHSVVDQVDTTTIFNQYESWFNEHSQVKAIDFEEWKTVTRTSLENWINAQEIDYQNWADNNKGNFANWFVGIKEQLEAVDIGSHVIADFPHHFVDSETGVTYKYGWKANNGLLQFVYEEVI